MSAKKHTFLYKGKKVSFKEMAALSGLPLSTVYSRKKRGWTVDEAIEGKRQGQQFELRRKNIKIHYTGRKYPLSYGKRLSLGQWAREIGVSVHTLRARSYRKWSANEIIEGRENKIV
jgi:hypothetical protein